MYDFSATCGPNFKSYIAVAERGVFYDAGLVWLLAHVVAKSGGEGEMVRNTFFLKKNWFLCDLLVKYM